MICLCRLREVTGTFYTCQAFHRCAFHNHFSPESLAHPPFFKLPLTPQLHSARIQKFTTLIQPCRPSNCCVPQIAWRVCSTTQPTRPRWTALFKTDAGCHLYTTRTFFLPRSRGIIAKRFQKTQSPKPQLPQNRSQQPLPHLMYWRILVMKALR